MANKKKDTVTFGISQEELMVILAYLKANEFLGIDEEDLKAYEQDQIDLVMSLAERALIARGFIVRDSNKPEQMQLAPLPFAVVGACAFPEITIMVGQNRKNQLEQNTFFHCSRKMNVGHSLPMTFIHQFIAFEDRLELAKAITSILALTDFPELPKLSAITTMKTLADARYMAENGDMQKTQAILLDGGVSESVAIELTRVLKAPLVNTSLSFIDHKNDHVDGFALLGSEKSHWLLRPDETTDVIEISTIASKEVISQLKKWLSI